MTPEKLYLESKDINFLELSEKEFEELCFDLIIESGFEKVLWRKGSSDDGRDIEGIFRREYSLLGSIEEKWFFECKRYKKPLTVDNLSSKMAWADAERPRHLVICTSSYLTNQCLGWLERIRPTKAYLIHIVNGDSLVSVVLKHQKIAEKYFGEKYKNLFKQSKMNWLVYGIMPSHEIVSKLINNIEIENLDESDRFFYLAYFTNVLSYLSRPSMSGEVTFSKVLEKEISRVRYDKKNINPDKPLSRNIVASRRLTTGSDYNQDEVVGENYFITTDVRIRLTDKDLDATYYFFVTFKKVGLELLFVKRSDFMVLFNLFTENAESVFNETRDKLVSLDLLQ